MSFAINRALPPAYKGFITPMKHLSDHVFSKSWGPPLNSKKDIRYHFAAK
jgi:hypothetical protein